jgi:negative elongation factor E
MNGSMVSGIQLKVSLARRQPVIEPINDASSSATWSTIGCFIELSRFDEMLFIFVFSISAARNSQKGSYKDKRDLVTYEEELF